MGDHDGVARALVVSLAPFASAQTPPKGRQGSPMYDVTSETTIIGTIENIETITGSSGRGRRGLGGTHLVVKTKTETLEVHIGPTAYLAEQRITLAKGDAVEIFGSRVTIDEEPVLLARQITKGSAKWTLRDASGRPLWTGPRR
jgi:hypothetical protein